MRRLSQVVFVLSSVCFGAPAVGSPISVGGFTFPDGEAAFADDALIVSGVITGADTEGVRRILVGSNIADSFNTGDSGGGIVEVRFLDNLILNGPGTDLVIFELSGDKPTGTPDPREVFGFSAWVSGSFTPFVTMTPIATGYPDPADGSLDLFKIEVDLSNFGISPVGFTDRIRLHIYNSNLGSKSADLTALGALHSQPVPEPSSSLLAALGILILAVSRSQSKRLLGKNEGRARRGHA